MDAKNLSKCKYIYRVYMSKIGVVHLEKYRIVYSNAAYVYFKIPGDDRLCEIGVNKIHEDIMEIIEYTKFHPGISIFLWNDEGITKESFIRFLKKFEIESIKREVKNHENRCIQLNKSLELVSSKLKPLKKRLESLEDEFSKMDKTENV